MKYLLSILMLIPSIALAQGERYLYSAQVNQYIPDDDSTGVRDTIFIPDHILISDINFYVGVSNGDYAWAENVLIDVFSPSRSRVRLNDWGGVRIWYYDIWYDTQWTEDGPGQLEDYAGGDAYGNWEMFCFDPFEDDSLIWYTWRIEVIGDPINGISESDPAVPTDYTINDIYPNPFNGQTAISYAVPNESYIKLEIFDIGGRRIKRLLDETSSAGYFQIIWDGRNDTDAEISSGIYIIKLTGPDREVLKRATLLK